MALTMEEAQLELIWWHMRIAKAEIGWTRVQIVKESGICWRRCIITCRRRTMKVVDVVVGTMAS